MNKVFDMLLDFLGELVPKGKEKLFEPFYILKKISGDLGFPYERIDAYSNDCMLILRENIIDRIQYLQDIEMT